MKSSQPKQQRRVPSCCYNINCANRKQQQQCS